MKNLFFLIGFLSCTSCFASDRIKMQEFPESEQNIRTLVENVCESANSQDANKFLDCFTKKKKYSSKKKIHDVFQRPIEMSIVKFDITSEQDNKIEFDFIYYWNYRTDPKQLITTKVIAKKENNAWKIDDSKISKKEVAPVDDGLPQDIGRHNFGACANGKCNVPAINMNVNQGQDDGLPSDIGRHNLGACPGGKCNLPR